MHKKQKRIRPLMIIFFWKIGMNSHWIENKKTLPSPTNWNSLAKSNSTSLTWPKWGERQIFGDHGLNDGDDSSYGKGERYGGNENRGMEVTDETWEIERLESQTLGSAAVSSRVVCSLLCFIFQIPFPFCFLPFLSILGDERLVVFSQSERESGIVGISRRVGCARFSVSFCWGWSDCLFFFSGGAAAIGREGWCGGWIYERRWDGSKVKMGG